MGDPTLPDVPTSAGAHQTSAPPLDRWKLEAERKAATKRLLARLKALYAAHGAQTSRAYTASYIREQAPSILRLLDTGVTPDEIFADLSLILPSLPKADLRCAIEQLRDRRRRRSSE